MSRAAMSYWLLNLCSMTNGLPKHWSLLLIWFLITNNNTLVHPVPPTKGLPITMYPRAGVLSLPSLCPWVAGYNTSHSEHPLDVLLIATTPTLAQLVSSLFLSGYCCCPHRLRPSAWPLGWIQGYLYKLACHFTTPFVSTCPLCILIRSFGIRSHFSLLPHLPIHTWLVPSPALI